MIDDSDDETGQDGATDGDAAADDRDDAVALLMSIAGQRAAVPPGVEARVRAEVEREWRDATSFRRTLKWSVPAALAASVLLAWTFVAREPAPEPIAIGTVARVVGDVNGVSVGQRLHAGNRLQVPADGGIAIELGDRTSLRLAAGSELGLDGARGFTLMAGRVYVDTGESIYPRDPVRISTSFGAVTDVGTQFAVALGGSELQVAVREGEVNIATNDRQVAAEAGQRVILTESSPPVTENIAATDPEWQWATELAPQFTLDGQSVLDFLKWVSRETGLELEFPENDDRLAAMAARLHGTIDGLTPMEALASVMPTTRFSYVIDGDAISVSR